MGLKNPVHTEGIYFVTITVVDWVDVFTRPSYRYDIVDSLRFCQQKKGLELYAWVLMSNHLHLLASAADGFHLSNILRDFKRHTSTTITRRILTEPESRRRWMMNQFEFSGRYDPKIDSYRFWQEGNEAKETFSPVFMMQKLQYIHDNPVRAELVDYPEQYRFSSARNYAGEKGLLDVIIL